MASTQSCRDDLPGELREQLALELQPLRHGLDHQLGGGELGRARRPAHRPRLRGRRRIARQPAALDAARERGGDALGSRRERRGHRVVQQRPGPGAAGQLGDPGAHRAGAEDARSSAAARRSLQRDERVDARQRPADDQALDLRGALVQRRHPDVAEVALDRDGRRRSPAPPWTWIAVLAQWTADSVAYSLAIEVSVVFGRPASFSAPGAPHEHPGRVGAHLHVGEHRLHELERRRSAGRTGPARLA